MVPSGYVAGLQLDPIEKKPFNHFLPGALTLSFGMVGCNFQCSFCQNWLSAQALNDPSSRFSEQYLHEIEPKEIVQSAKKNRAKAIVSTYNEPLITSEWAIEIFSLAHQAGIKTAFVSNGLAHLRGLEKLAPYLDAMKIDLKSFSEDTYKELGGHLKPVLNTITTAIELGIWVEVVTLLIPEMNDSPTELWDITRFLAGTDRNIPWHVTAFHPDYKLTDRDRTSAKALQTAAEIGQEAGLTLCLCRQLAWPSWFIRKHLLPSLSIRIHYTTWIPSWGIIRLTTDGCAQNARLPKLLVFFQPISNHQHYPHMV
jgi:pyruvate formate lyase activating enzyme